MSKAARVRDYAALAARVRAAGNAPVRLRVYGQQRAPVGTGGPPGYDLLMVDVPARSRRRRWSALLNGGTHGDEPAGAEALVRFLEERRYLRWPDVAFTVTPCTNPWGYEHSRREGPGGVDLNRSFRRAGVKTPQVSLLKRALRGRTYDLFVDCHEDVDAPGLYVYAPGALGRAIVSAVRPLGPVHAGDFADEDLPLERGVVVLDGDELRERRRAFSTWPLPFYVARYHQREANQADPTLGATATIETPTALPLAQRVQMHLTAIDASLATLSDK